METFEILLIEDSPDDVELTLRAFKKREIFLPVKVLRDGAEALEFFFGKNPASLPRVIFLDLKLPKVSGMEVLAKLKGDERTKNVPVVVLTSSEDNMDIVQSYRLGANSYIVKPVDYDKFFGAICDAGLYWVYMNRKSN